MVRDLENLLADNALNGARIRTSEVFSGAHKLIAAELQWFNTQRAAEYLRSIAWDASAPFHFSNAQSLASLYASPDAQANLEQYAAKVGVPLLNVLVADMCKPFHQVATRFLDAGVWNGFAETTYTMVAILWRDHTAFAQRLAKTDVAEGDRNLVGELIEGVIRYGRTNDASMVQQLESLYRMVTQLIPTEDRSHLASDIAQLYQENRVTGNALLPFLFVESSVSVIATAALRFAEIAEPEGGDPLTGARYLLQWTNKRDETTKVGILSGLLLLGDRRVVEFLGPCWRGLSMDGREDLSHMRSGFLYAPLIEWFIEWLEDCEGNEFGIVAAALTRMPEESVTHRVQEVKRQFPVSRAEPGHEIEVVKEWPIAEYASLIAPRLRGIAARETEPRVMPYVLERWGLA